MRAFAQCVPTYVGPFRVYLALFVEDHAIHFGRPLRCDVATLNIKQDTRRVTFEDHRTHPPAHDETHQQVVAER